jgi:murein DD-endopeptidase MepM/ murein hydrolase activator NlpD
MKASITLALSALLLLSSCSRNEPPSEIVQARKPRPYHIVKAGQTPAIVAKIYGMTEQEFIRINRLKPPYNLLPGQRVIVVPRDGQKEGEPIGPSTPQQETEVAVQTTPQPPVTTAPASAEGAAITPGAQPVAGPLPQAPVEGALTTSPATTTAAESAAKPVAAANFEWPVKGGKVIQNFGQKLKDGSISEGINIAAPKGTLVTSIASGVVKQAGQKIPAFGKMVVTKLDDGRLAVYAHMDKIEPAIKEGARITAGQTIGAVGDSGIAKGVPQLHLQIRNKHPDVKPMDPMPFFK